MSGWAIRTDQTGLPVSGVGSVVGLAAIALLYSQPAPAESLNQLPVAHENSAGLNEFRVPTGRDVVMVQIEAAIRQSAICGELMQFIERGIADKMSPEHSVCGPHWLVDEHGHASESKPGPGLTACLKIR